MAIKSEHYGSVTLITLPPWRWIPNSILPVVFFPGSGGGNDSPPASTLRIRFRQNGWTNNWTAGIYPYPHYHSTTHEVLGISHGTCDIQLGGPEGYTLHATAGDVLVLPAGVAHACYTLDDYTVVGGYPGGRDWDMNTETSAHRAPLNLPLPERDPIGNGRVLREVWAPEGRRKYVELT